MNFPRRSGILLHPTSLPSRFGIGDFGPTAYQFIDFLEQADQAYWQMLPLNPTGFGDSPYQTLSAFAGNPLLISLEQLVEAEYLAADDLATPPDFSEDAVEFERVTPFKLGLLHQAFATFQTQPRPSAFTQFCAAEAHWLDDYALFASLKEQFELRPWTEWDNDIAQRRPKAVATWQNKLAKSIERHQFWQWLFMQQLDALKQYANERSIKLIGDIPIFVAMDSADVWANTDLFQLDDQFEPIIVSGVPPDSFSATGQHWGHPHYRWDVMAERGYAWWISRFKMMMRQTDIIRIDHFRGFYDYWAIPGDAPTAETGEWVLGPGAELFRAVTAGIGRQAIIAEDLGQFEPDALAGLVALQSEFGYPGMKIMTYAFSDPGNEFLPHNTGKTFFAYTGTHDNDTIVGWYERIDERERDFVRRYLAVSGHDIAWDLIRAVWSTVAVAALTTAQDLLTLDNSARMNYPSTVGAPNWMWRIRPNALDDNIVRRLADLTWLYGRSNR